MKKKTKLQMLIKGYGNNFPHIDLLLASIPNKETILAMNSPIPALGRYRKSVNFMKEVTSGKAVGIKRFYVAKQYLLALSQIMESYRGKYKNKKVIERLSKEDVQRIMQIGLTEIEVWQAEQIEKFTDHDTAAATDYLKIRIATEIPHLDPYIEAVHFALTSEDVMGNVFGMIGNELIFGHFMTRLIDFCLDILDYCNIYEMEKVLAIPGLTHRQPAEPTSPYKRPVATIKAILQLMAFLSNDHYQFNPFPGKMGSALGNMLTQSVAYPDIDWQNFNKKYVKSLGLSYEPMTHQSSMYAMESQIFATIANILTQICKLTEDFIVSAAAPAQFSIKRKKAGEKGSSIMPNKSNAWASEGGIKMLRKTRNVLEFLAKELPDYPFEGDMGRSFLFRDIGNDFMPAFIALDRISSEIKRYAPNPAKIAAFFKEYPGMAGSALQTVLKREKVEGDAYREIQSISLNPDGTSANSDQFTNGLERKMEELNLVEELRNELRSLLIPNNLVKHLEKPLKKEVAELRRKLTLYRESATKFLTPIENTI